jgi:predicted NBD/HSP70 family sugar kinase
MNRETHRSTGDRSAPVVQPAVEHFQEIKPGLFCQDQFLSLRGLGADTGGTTYKIGETLGLTLLTKDTVQQPSRWADGPRNFAQSIVESWTTLAAKSGRKLRDYHFFSCAMCGPTNSTTGTVLRITNRGSELWQRHCFRNDLVEALTQAGVQSPVVSVGNDGMFFNLGEWASAVMSGRVSPASTFVTVCPGTGLAFGAMLSGMPWKGDQGEGAEEGHRSCDPVALCRLAGVDLPIQFPQCGCGNPGTCLEKTPACVDGLVALVQSQINAGRWPGEKDARKLALSFLDRADQGDAAAWEVIRIQMMLVGMILAELHRTYKSPVYCCPGAYSTRPHIQERCLQAIYAGFEANRAFRDPDDPDVLIYPGACGENAAVFGGILFGALRSGVLKISA